MWNKTWSKAPRRWWRWRRCLLTLLLFVPAGWQLTSPPSLLISSNHVRDGGDDDRVTFYCCQAGKQGDAGKSSGASCHSWGFALPAIFHCIELHRKERREKKMRKNTSTNDTFLVSVDITICRNASPIFCLLSPRSMIVTIWVFKEKREKFEMGGLVQKELSVNIVSWGLIRSSCHMFNFFLLRFVQHQLGVIWDMFYSSCTYFSLFISLAKH